MKKFYLLTMFLSILFGASAMAQDEAQEDWVTVFANTMSGTTPGSWDSDGIVVANWMDNNYSGGVLEGLPYSYSMSNPDTRFGIHYKVEVPKKGSYKFSYRARLEGSITLGLKLSYMRWTQDYNMSMFPYDNLTEASEEVLLTSSTSLPGTLIESDVIELNAGTYYFTILRSSASGSGGLSSRCWLGDFKLNFLNDGSYTTYALHINAGEGGTVAVSDGISQLQDGTNVLNGTELTVTATPSYGYELGSVKVNGADFENGGTFTVTEETTIDVTFDEQERYTVSWELSDASQGTIQVYDSSLRYISNGQSVVAGTTVFTDVTPAAGYEVESMTLNGEDYDGKMFVVNEDCHLVVTFKSLTRYTVNYTFDGEEYGTMTVTKSYTVDELPSGSEVDGGQSIMVTVEMDDPATTGTITVNGSAEQFSYSEYKGTFYKHYVVNSDMEISVVLTNPGGGLDALAVQGVWYDALSETLCVDGCRELRIYDVTGHLVVDAMADTSYSVAGLASGVYVAVVDGQTFKFRK